ncbi:MAG: ABC transporter permease, partial [Solirubrobacteraceae bacterium]|nr:ABC transporter permease [Solirubrobacteraceae bacterium]
RRAEAASWSWSPPAANSDAERREAEQRLLQADSGALVARIYGNFRGPEVLGILIQKQGPVAPAPPGLRTAPGPGEVAVSPALAGRLAGPGGDLLRQRLPGRVIGQIDRDALPGPNDLRWYAGSTELSERGLERGDVAHIEAFGSPGDGEISSALRFVLLIGAVVLLFPIAILVATAARFGSARRDRRLAALRLLGGSRRETVRIAAGEALAGTVAGLVVGAAIFLVGRVFVDRVTVFSLSLQGSDLRPSLVLTALMVVGVLATTIGATVFSMRRVAVEPLAVSRRGGQPRRRLWWRPLPAAAGFALLLTGSEEASDLRFTAGTLLVLLGVVLLLPWLIDALVRRAPGWSVSSQLALRTLGSDSATAARIVSGVAVAVAGAIALQMLFASAGPQQTAWSSSAAKPSTADAIVSWTGPAEKRGALRASLRRTEGVTGVSVLATRYLDTPGAIGAALVTGTCDDLREFAEIGACHDGDAFIADVPPTTQTIGGQAVVQSTALPKAGGEVRILKSRGAGQDRWRAPVDATTVAARLDASGQPRPGIYVTPSVTTPPVNGDVEFTGAVHLDPSDPDARQRLEATVAQFDLFASTWDPSRAQEEREVTVVRRILLAGSSMLLLLIAESLAVTTLEQLGERRRTLATLAAFGTPRATLRRAVGWQVAIPMLLGLALATVTGIGLGSAFVWVQGAPVQVDVPSVLGLLAVGCGLIGVVTAAALPLLRRVASPASLRSE